MRILVITNMYPPHHYGGYELLCQEVVEGFRQRGHDVLVLTSTVEVPGVQPDDPSEHEPVRRELELYWQDHEILRPPLRECLRIERTNQAALRRALEDHRPDVVSIWAMGCMSLGILRHCHQRGLPMVHVVCDDWTVYAPLVDRWSAWWSRLGPMAVATERILRVPCRPPDLGRHGTFCFISSSTKRTAEQGGRRRFPDAPVVLSGINVADFPIGAASGRPAWSGRLLHVGRIDERKGIDVAISALASLPGCTLEVVGRGDDSHLAELRRHADRLGVGGHVRFDVADRRELADRYRAADALLFLPRWSEPFGLVPLEAMACGTPVVATASGGSAEFLEDGKNCLVVPIDDPGAVADAVRGLAEDDDLRQRLVGGGFTTAAELTIPRWVEVLEAWHVATADGFRHGRPAGRTPISRVLAGLG